MTDRFIKQYFDFLQCSTYPSPFPSASRPTYGCSTYGLWLTPLLLDYHNYSRAGHSKYIHKMTAAYQCMFVQLRQWLNSPTELLLFNVHKGFIPTGCTTLFICWLELWHVSAWFNGPSSGRLLRYTAFVSPWGHKDSFKTTAFEYFRSFIVKTTVVCNSTAQELRQYKMFCTHNTASHVFKVVVVNVILRTNCWGDHHKALEFVYWEWRLHFCSTCLCEVNS